MPATAAYVGATLGVGAQIYSNAVRKLPVLRSEPPQNSPTLFKVLPRVLANVRAGADPWEHVAFAGFGGLLGSSIAAWEAWSRDVPVNKYKLPTPLAYFTLQRGAIRCGR